MCKKVLLAGGAGYIGSQLAPKLLSRDYKVTVVDELWFGNYLPEAVELWQKDIMTLTTEELKKFDAVVFMAGLSNDPMADFSPSKNFIENTAVPAYLAYITKKAGVRRFVYASSCSVYGYAVDKLMTEEEPDLNTEYPYGISKLIGEKAIMEMADDNFKPISLRKGTVGGWSPRMRFDLVVNAMTKSALKNGEIIVNNPSLWRPVIDIEDVCTAYIRSIEAGNTVSGVYNICYDNYTIGRLGDEICSELRRHGHKVKMKIMNKQDVRNYKADNTKAKVELDFVPSISPSDSVRNILKKIGPEFDFDDEKYYNITTFKDIFK